MPHHIFYFDKTGKRNGEWEMRYRRLGKEGPEVSEISIGSWLTFSGGIEAEAAQACIDAAFEVGVNFFDTANVYGRGAAEEALASLLAGRPRDSYVLATKLCLPMSDDPADRGLSAAQIAKQIDTSLRRLGTDYVDVYYAHRADPEVEIEETVEAFQRVVAAGKARHLGFSEWTVEQIEAAVEVGGEDLFAASTPQYSMLWRAPEAELFELTARLGIGNVVWWPLAQGVLTGKYKPGAVPPADSRAASGEMGGEMEEVMSDAALEAVQRLLPVAAEAGIPLPTLALAWALQRDEVCSALVGVSRPEQVHANAEAAGVELSPDLLAAIDAALGDAPVTGPAHSNFTAVGVKRR
jgi:aryl-alcohol dehydrogenase-like predicted oxidoreductase